MGTNALITNNRSAALNWPSAQVAENPSRSDRGVFLVNLPRGGVGGDRRSRGDGHGGGGWVGCGGRWAVLAIALRRFKVEVSEHHRPRRRRVCLRHRLRRAQVAGGLCELRMRVQDFRVLD